jgi:Hydrolytic ATP binding site of dynein motor region
MALDFVHAQSCAVGETSHSAHVVLQTLLHSRCQTFTYPIQTRCLQDLGKTVGMRTVVFNCGAHLDHHFMTKFFAGLAQCGAWACFDEFNRINIEVLSVVAQQLSCLQNAAKTQAAEFVFEGDTIPFVPSCAVFITMNPDYAERTELPGNLQALFRPLAMMIPDYTIIAEVMLFTCASLFGQRCSCAVKADAAAGYNVTADHTYECVAGDERITS